MCSGAIYHGNEYEIAMVGLRPTVKTRLGPMAHSFQWKHFLLVCILVENPSICFVYTASIVESKINSDLCIAHLWYWSRHSLQCTFCTIRQVALDGAHAQSYYRLILLNIFNWYRLNGNVVPSVSVNQINGDLDAITSQLTTIATCMRCTYSPFAVSNFFGIHRKMTVLLLVPKNGVNKYGWEHITAYFIEQFRFAVPSTHTSGAEPTNV